MTCLICKTGDCMSGITSFTHLLNEIIVVAKHLKASICNNCGEAYYDTETADYIQTKTKEAIKNHQEVELFTV